MTAQPLRMECSLQQQTGIMVQIMQVTTTEVDGGTISVICF